MFHKCTNEDLNYFKEVCGESEVCVEDQIHEDFTRDEMTEYGCYKPDVVVFVKNTEQVSKVVSYCNDKNIALTVRGSGTGLCGGSVAILGGVVLAMNKMNKIIEIDHNTLTAIVEPGVLLMELAQAASDEGFLYAPDPGEKSATIGGNVSTNAGGMRAVKYGVTRDYIKGLEVVMANGEVLQLGGKVAKSSSGYSLKDLIIGSEGTLCVVTKIYAKLLAKPSKMISLLVPFSDLNQCLKVVNKVLSLADRPVTIEFMEKEVIDDSCEYLGKQFPNKGYNAYLIISYNGNSKKEIEEMYEPAANLCLSHGALDVFISDTQERQDSVWSARGAFLEAIKNSTTTMDECDVVVDINLVGEFMKFVKELSEKYEVRIRSFGHAGDGNLHVYVCKDDLTDERWETVVNTCMDQMYEKAIQLNGQVSGEHGIGHAKKKYLRQSIGETQIELMRQIKKVFDPKGILNPNKVFDLKGEKND